MTIFRRALSIAALSLGLAPLAHANPDTGAWSEHTHTLAGGLEIQSVEAEACYAVGSSGGSGIVAHVQRIATRLIDASCTAQVETEGVDAGRFVIQCGGPSFGDGVASVLETDSQHLKVSITFHNNATDMDTSYATDSAWLRPKCNASN